MLYLLQALSWWWLAALALGLLVGIRARFAGIASGGGWLMLVGYLFLLGALAAATSLLPGRAGLWLETALLAVAAYGIGCGCGCVVGSLFGGGSPAPSGDITAAVTEFSAQANALAAAAPVAIAANAEAQTLLQSPPAAPPLVVEPAPAPRAEPASEAEKIAGLRSSVEAPPAPTPEAAPSSLEERSGARPPSIDRPQDAADEDDLRLIRGIDPTLSHELHEIGVWRFSQIAAWTPEHLEWIARHLRQRSPASARFWPQQARLLATGALTDHARAVLKGETPPQADDMDKLVAWMARLPRLVAPGAGDGLYAGTRPAGLPEPSCGESDDLTRIEGVDAALAARLNGLGIWDWRQIAHWSPANARWIGAYLALPGAPERQAWVSQAQALAHEAISS